MKTGKCKFIKIVAVTIAMILAVSGLPQGSLVSANAAESKPVLSEPYDADLWCYLAADGGYASKEGELLATICGRTYTKANDGFALAGYAYGAGYTGPVVVSKDSEAAVAYKTNYDSRTLTSQGTLEYKGADWYLGSSEYWIRWEYSSTNGLAIKLENNTDYTELAKQLIDRLTDRYAGEAESLKGIKVSSSIVAADQSAMLTWDEISGADHYDVFRNGYRIATDVKKNEYNDKTTEASSSYEYYIVAVDAAKKVLGKGKTSTTETLPELVVSESMKLTSDMSVFSLSIDNNIPLDLNGHSLSVARDAYIGYSGGITFNGGKMTVYGNLSQSTYGRVIMDNAKDLLEIHGNYDLNAECETYLQGFNNGTVKLYGDLNADKGFRSEGGFKLVLNGGSRQNININKEGGKAYFSHIDVKNKSKDGVWFNRSFGSSSFSAPNSNIYVNGELISIGYTLTEDVELSGNYILGAGTLDLNGKNLTIKGDLIHTGGEVIVNGGTLEIEGNYYLASRIKNDEGYVYGPSYGLLTMTNEEDKVVVAKDFMTKSKTSHENHLSAGTLEVKKNFYVYNEDNYTFACTGTHTVVFSGKEHQSVYFSSSNKDSRFNYTKFKNVNALYGKDGISYVTFQENPLNPAQPGAVPLVKGNFNDNGYRIGGYIDVCEDVSFTNGVYHGDLKIVGSVTLNNDYTIKGNLYYGTGSQVIVTGKVTIDGNIEAEMSYANIGTSGTDSSLHVTGDVLMSGTGAYLYQNRGTVQIDGDFTQNSTGD